jgi:SAM-dependent methyltransferase
MSAAIHEATGRSDFIGVKQDFTDAYNASSPRPLFTVYRNLDYKVPYHIEHFLAALTRFARQVSDTQSTRLVDIGCSYGINALMLKHGCRYAAIAQKILDGDGPDENLQSTLRGRGDPIKDIQVIGLDSSPNAIRYCEQGNLQDHSFCVNLELEEIPVAAAKPLRGANFILSSGVYGYISEVTTRKLVLAVADREALWVCNFVLRPIDYSPTIRILDALGFATETAPVLFPHRRFSSNAEREATIAFIQSHGNDPSPEVATNYLYTRLYISRSRKAGARFPLAPFWDREVAQHSASTLVADTAPVG